MKRRAWSIAALVLVLFTPNVCCRRAAAAVLRAADPLSIHDRRELFVDHYLIERLDGFASLHASLDGGTMVTKPLRFAGSRLELNASTGALGHVRVEIQDADGAPLPGFTRLDALPLGGDQVAHVVSWKRGPDLTPLEGRPIRLAFSLKDADVYSLKFGPAQ